MYARICPNCGCYLDPGEKCDCAEEQERKQKIIHTRHEDVQRLFRLEVGGQMVFAFVDAK